MVFPHLQARNANRKWTYASRWLAGLPLILLLFEAQRKQVFCQENGAPGGGQRPRRACGGGFRLEKPECVSDFLRNPYNRGTLADHDAVQQGQ